MTPMRCGGRVGRNDRPIGANGSRRIAAGMRRAGKQRWHSEFSSAIFEKALVPRGHAQAGGIDLLAPGIRVRAGFEASQIREEPCIAD